MKSFGSLKKCILAALLGLGLSAGIAGSSWADFDPGNSQFRVACGRDIIEYALQSVFALPGGILRLELADKSYSNQCDLTAPGCQTETSAPGVWQIHVPSQAGVYPARLTRRDTHASIQVQIFALIPFARLKNQEINGYRIGAYPTPGGKVAGYGRPLGFIEVTAANQNTCISPHFQLRQFLCKQNCRFPQYVVLRSELISKLEKIFEQLSLQGYSRPTLRILSGYRTPYYNHLIGDKRLSAHQWGLAADVCLEEDSRNLSDDLNGDGRVDVRDARFLFQLVERWDAQPEHAALVGGAGLYAPTRLHGPFVHVDARGYAARWSEGVPLPDRAASNAPENLKSAAVSSIRNPKF